MIPSWPRHQASWLLAQHRDRLSSYSFVDSSASLTAYIQLVAERVLSTPRFESWERLNTNRLVNHFTEQAHTQNLNDKYIMYIYIIYIYICIIVNIPVSESVYQVSVVADTIQIRRSRVRIPHWIAVSPCAIADLKKKVYVTVISMHASEKYCLYVGQLYNGVSFMHWYFSTCLCMNITMNDTMIDNIVLRELCYPFDWIMSPHGMVSCCLKLIVAAKRRRSVAIDNFDILTMCAI